MFKKAILVGFVIAMSSQAALAGVTCLVNGKSKIDKNTYDVPLAVKSVEALPEQSLILINKKKLYVTAHKNKESSQYQISVFKVANVNGTSEAEIFSLATSSTLPLTLLDGKSNLMISCY